jgi:hypothetical protein
LFDERGEGLVALLALLEIEVLLLPRGGIDCRLHGAQQRIDQGVVQFESLIHDEGNQEQKAVFVSTSRDLRNLGLDDRVGVVANALVAQAQALDNRFQVEIERLNNPQVCQIGSDFRRQGGWVRLFQQRQAVAPALTCAVAGILFQQFIELRALIFVEAMVDDFAERTLLAMERRDHQISQHVVAGDLYLLSGQELDDVQQDQFGPKLDAYSGRNLPGGVDLRRFVERAVAKIAQDDALMADRCCLVVGLDANLVRVDTDLARDVLDIPLAELQAKEFAPRLEVPSSQQKTDFIGGSAQVHHRVFEQQRQGEEALALGAVEHRRRLECFLLQRVEDLHSCHGKRSPGGKHAGIVYTLNDRLYDKEN